MADSTKESELNQLHNRFLEEMALSLSKNQNKHIRKLTKEDYVNYFTNKFTKSQVDEVIDLYSSGVPGSRVGKMISPDSVEVIVNSLDDHFQGEGIKEVKVGKRACDYVIPEALIAVEIKSGRDNLSKAESQIFDYKRWADKVYLVYDKTHKKRIPSTIKENGIGLLEFDGQLHEKKKPQRTPSDSLDLLNAMTKIYLNEISNVHGISSSGKKIDITKRLSNQLTTQIVRLWFGRFLYQRSG